VPTNIPTRSTLLSADERRTGNAPRAAIRRQIRITALIVLTLVGGVGGWASFTRIDGAVITAGKLVVESAVKKVQHPIGGTVGELRVREGDHVKAGDILVRLDETQPRSSLDIVLRALDVLAARRAREEAERDGDLAVNFPNDLRARAASDEAVAHLIEGETRLFAARAKARHGQKEQLRERIAQLDQQIAGLTDQIKANASQSAFITQELKGIRELWEKKLVPISRLTSLEREAARLEGERGSQISSIAEAKGKQAEVRLQILQVDQDMRNEVSKDLTDIRAKVSEYEEKQTAALDLLKHTDLRAPQDGVVHQMSVHTVGGLVTPNEPAMLIVPVSDELAVEAKINPQDIDHVRIGQPAVLRFAAFNQRTTPEIKGVVKLVSADVAQDEQDQKSGQFFYKATIQVPAAERARLGEVTLVPGMPVDAFLQIGERTVISYLTKPVLDQISKAWREH
jgi:HlyD family secretion protein